VQVLPCTKYIALVSFVTFLWLAGNLVLLCLALYEAACTCIPGTNYLRAHVFLPSIVKVLSSSDIYFVCRASQTVLALLASSLGTECMLLIICMSLFLQ
jgi:hypothetical protein